MHAHRLVLAALESLDSRRATRRSYRPGKVHMSLVREQANHDVWYTQDQLLYQQQVVDFYMQDAVNDALEQEFRGVQGHHVHAGQERRSRPDRAPRAE